MTNPLLWFQKMSADEKERFKTILIIMQVELPKNELTAYQGSNFTVAANNMSNFQTNMKSNLLERRPLIVARNNIFGNIWRRYGPNRDILDYWVTIIFF